MVKLALARVVAPRLRHAQANLVLGANRFSEILRNGSFDKITQLRHLAITQDEVVCACRVAHVGPSILTSDEIHLTLGQVSTELEERHRRRE